VSNVTLRLGDCLEILPTLADKCADAIITDLPYGTTACSWDVIIPFAPMWEQVKRLCKGAFVTTASQPFTSLLIMSNTKMYRYELIWDKVNTTGFLNANKAPLKRHENVVVFSSNGHTYNPQFSHASPKERGSHAINRAKFKTKTSVYGEPVKAVSQSPTTRRYPVSIINLGGSRQADKVHPTQKPVALYEYLIKTYTNPGDTVLDFCMGSGTTIVAAIKTGRNAIGIEKRPDYFEIAQRRVNEAQQTVMEFA
jgi:site-specific DNA-methyltransferase (adenine-specific)